VFARVGWSRHRITTASRTRSRLHCPVRHRRWDSACAVASWSCNRCQAAERLRAWLRCVSQLTTKPEGRCSSRTAVARLLTFCPPGPRDRMNEHRTSRACNTEVASSPCQCTDAYQRARARGPRSGASNTWVPRSGVASAYASASIESSIRDGEAGSPTTCASPVTGRRHRSVRANIATKRRASTGPGPTLTTSAVIVSP
jgi:hypothetical protein